MPLQIRRGTNAERIAMSVPLAQGELLYVTDDQRLYIGNGTTLGGVQITGYTNEDAQDAAASMFTSGTHNGISFTYGVTQDGLNRIDATVDLSNYQGLIRADALRGSLFADDSSLLVNAETGEFNGTLIGDSRGYHTGNVKGSVFSEDSTLLVDGVSGTFNLAGKIKGNVYPAANEVYDLGTSGARFKDLYLSGSSIHLGNAIITSSGSAVDLPLGSTIGGFQIGTGGLVNGSDYNINIIGDDSSIMVNSATNEFKGNLNGSVYADDNTLLVDAVTGTIHGSFEGYQVNLSAVKIYADFWFRDVGVSVYSASNTGGGGYVDCNVSENTTDDPQPLTAGEFVGGFRVNAYKASNEYVASVVLGSEISLNADLNANFPASNAIIAVANDNDFIQYKFNANGTFESVGAVQVGVFTDTPETRPTGVKGMIIFNDTTGQFEGYNGTSWVALSAPPGP